jgi:hypothetical protein
MPTSPKGAQLARLTSVVCLLSLILAAACTAPEPPPFRYRNDNVASDGADKSKKKPPAPSNSGQQDTTPPPSGNGAPAEQGPVLTSVAPDATTVGSSPAGVDLTLTGSRFVAGCKVDLAGRRLDATLRSPTTLEVHVPADALTASGVRRLSVFSPSNVESNALSFTVANPTSVSIVTLAPSTTTLGAGSVSITVTGTGFISTSIVKFNGASLTTTFTSPTSLFATIPDAAMLAAGKYGVTVSSGADVVSLPSSFEVRNPTPSLSTLSPRTVDAGSAAIAVTIDGSNFTKSSEVFSGGTPLATTYVSASRLRATLPSSLLSKAASLTIRVSTPGPGGGQSGAQTFTVQAVAGQPVSCNYTCTAYGYAPNECYEDWKCDATDGCLYPSDCSAAANPACVYKCSDYGYAPNQCSQGWICIASGQYAGCLGQTTCP